MQKVPNGDVPIFDKDAPPLLSSVSSPKIDEINLRYGQFLAYPLRAPRASHLAGNAQIFEGARYVVLKIEPDERPEMAWTNYIKVGDCVSMADGPHTLIMRVDLKGSRVPMRCAGISKSSEKLIGHILNMNLGQVLAWDSREVRDSEYLDVAKTIAAMKAASERQEMLSRGPNG